MKAIVLNRVALVLAFAGVFVSGVLSIGEYFKYQIPCGASHGCGLVAGHPSSHALGIPNAYLGVLAYLLIAALAYIRLVAPGVRWPLVAGYVLSALGTLSSLALTVVAVTVIRATCIWCLTSMAIMVALLIDHAMLMQQGVSSERATGIFNGVFLAGLVFTTAIALGVEGSSIVEAGRSPGELDVKNPIELYLPAGVHYYGDPKAKVTLLEFGDLLCPTCQNEYSQAMTFIAKHPGKVKYGFRHFPLYKLQGHEQSAPAAIMSEIADEKGLFWQFLGGMYSEVREGQTIDSIMDVAKSFGLDPDETMKRMTDKNDPAFKRVMRDLEDGSKIGITGTPTFFIIVDGQKGVRQPPMASVWDVLEGPEFQKIYKGG